MMRSEPKRSRYVHMYISVLLEASAIDGKAGIGFTATGMNILDGLEWTGTEEECWRRS